MLALGEDPEEFEALKQQLMTAYGPGDALWEAQIDELGPALHSGYMLRQRGGLRGGVLRVRHIREPTEVSALAKHTESA